MPTLNPYPAYIDTDLPWLPKVPKHWEVKRLKHVTNITFSSVDKLSHEHEKPVLLSNYVDVYKNEQITSELEFMNATASDDEIERFTLRKNDVMITKDSESWNDIAVPAYVPNDLENVLCGYHLALIRPNSDEVDGKFLLRALQSKTIRYQFEVEATGITRYGIDQYAIGSTFFPTPPLPEQEAIAAYLDRQTAKIDALIAKKQRLLDLLAEQRASLISQAVTKGLNPDVKMKDSGVAWLGQVPRHWDVKRNRFLFKEQNIRSETGEETLLMVHQKLGIVPRQDYMDARPVIADTLIGYKVCYEDDLVLNKLKGHLGIFYRATAHGIVSPDYTVLRKISNIHTKYYEYLFRYTSYVSEFKKVSKGVGTGFLRLYTEEFSDVPSLVPPYHEQLQIIEHIDQETKRLSNLTDKVETAIERLQEYRAALISSVVTGKVQVYWSEP